jgi:hypothetical protein
MKINGTHFRKSALKVIVQYEKVHIQKVEVNRKEIFQENSEVNVWKWCLRLA